MTRGINVNEINPIDGEEHEHEPNPTVISKKISEFLQSEKAFSVSDVSLISSDGVRIPATRALLIIRSSFFEKLFTSGFAEKNSSEVHISLCATPLRHVLEFIYTDDCALIRDIRCNQGRYNQSYKMVSDLELDGVIELALAADYVQVPKLLFWCKEALHCHMRKSSSSLCILRKLSGYCATWVTSVKEFALTSLLKHSIFPNVHGCSTSEVIAAVVSFDDDTLEAILKQIISKSEIKQEVLFQILLVWTNNGCEHQKHSSIYCCGTRIQRFFVDVSKMNLSQSNRLPTAKRIAHIFDLTKFSAEILSEVVEKSGICNVDDIFRAYKRLALNVK